MKKLPINERFHTWQGEGVHMGRSAYFIRTQGCPIKCPWCDSAGTWHPDHVPAEIEKADVDSLVQSAVAARPEIVVITGGEPTVHDLYELTTALRANKLPVHLETSGAFKIRGDFDWITVSPKRWQKPLRENVQLATEIKIIVEDEQAIDFWMEELGELLTGKIIWLVPEWSQRQNSKILATINNAVKHGKNRFRAGYQMHKLFGVDEEKAEKTQTF